MKTKLKYCKNKHAIGEGIVVLSGVVGVCTKCGHKYLVESIPAEYIKDVRNELGERFHIYGFLSLMMCSVCHAWMTRLQIACHPNSDLWEDWRNALEEKLTLKVKEKEMKDEKSDSINSDTIL